MSALTIEMTTPVVPDLKKNGRDPRDGFFRGLLSRVRSWMLGTVFCLNLPVLSFITALAAVGWICRWMQARVLWGWWRTSVKAGEGGFHEFLARHPELGVAGRWPRWLWWERGSQSPTKGRWLGSLGLNFKLGLQMLFSTYLLTGWGCLLMMTSWYLGWLNSFHKGYEQAWIGPTTGLLGSLLLVLAMFYVPLAQVHQAVTGEIKSFFHVRFIWSLVKAKLTGLLGLAILFVVFSIPLEIARLLVASDQFLWNDRNDIEAAHVALRQLFLGTTFVFFALLLITRGLAARLYRTGVLKVLQKGTFPVEDLHPRLALWLTRLDLLPAPKLAPGGLIAVVAKTSRWSYQRFLFVAVFLVWFAFVFRFYAGYFFVATDAQGFLNHPLVQIPCVDYTPWHMILGKSE